MRIVDTTGLNWSAEEQAQFKALGEFIQVPVLPKTEIELIDWLQDGDYAILFPLSNSNISRRVFEQSPKLKGISIFSTGFSWIDTKAAKKQGVIISNVGNSSAISVAEFAITLMFALARKIITTSSIAKNGYYQLENFIGSELNEKILGVIGLGTIGTYIAKLAQGIGMRVIAYNRTHKESPIPLVSIEQLLQQADVISISLALNEQTECFLNADRLSLVKPTSMVINISPESLIDQEVIYKLLVSKRISGYAFELDDFPSKYQIKEKLLELNNVIATPHMAWCTSEAIQRYRQTTITNIRAMINGKPINTV